MSAVDTVVAARSTGPADARERLLGGTSEITGESWRRAWLPMLLVTAIGGFLRFFQLGRPHQLVFDETYYVKQAYSLLLHGVELRNDSQIAKPDELFTQGTPDVFGSTGDFVVHPPVGKWMIAFGEWLFGIDSSFGWRFSAAVIGTLSILLIGRIARRMFRSTLLGVTASILLAVDGEHFVESRTSLLDIFLMWWVLVAFAFVLIDRDHARERLARAVAERGVKGFGPRIGFRGWRLAAGVSLGLACGVKWSGIYVLAVFGLLTVLWDAGARRAVGVRPWFVAAIWRDGIGAFLLMVPIALVTYLTAWIGWFRSDVGWDRQWGAEHSSRGLGRIVPDALRSLWHYHQQAYAFHVGLDSPHPYSANPWSWLVQGRPTSFFYEAKTSGVEGCTVDNCSKAITSLGTPVLWWTGLIALVVLLFCWIFRRDWRAGAILAGYAGAYLPWFQYQHRTIFTFYAVVFVPFVVLAVVYLLGVVLGADPGTAVLKRGVQVEAALWRRRVGATVAGVVVVLCVACFAFFWPIYTAQVIPYESWSRRMWLPSWI